MLSSSSSSWRCISQNWHQSAEGQGVIAHLTDPDSGTRKLYGVLERPLLPPTVSSAAFKLFLWGRSGVGKTSLVSFLGGVGLSSSSSSLCETPGLRVTDVYWPVKLVVDSRIVLLKLSLWDFGEAAGRKYAHINPVCREGASGCLLVFSFCDRNSFQEVQAQLDRIAELGSAATFCPIVVGTRYGAVAETEVTHPDVQEFEAKWKLPVCKVRNLVGQDSSGGGRSVPNSNPNEVAAVLNSVSEQLWAHALRQRQQQASLNPSLI